jgi:hypothetical protein
VDAEEPVEDNGGDEEKEKKKRHPDQDSSSNSTIGSCKPSACKPVKCEPVECKPVECEPVECKPVECKPVECQPVKCEPVACKPGLCKPGKPRSCSPCKPAGPCEPVPCRPVNSTEVESAGCPPVNCGPDWVPSMSVPVALVVGATASLVAIGLATTVGLILRYLPPLVSGFIFITTIIFIWYVCSHYPGVARDLGQRALNLAREATTTLVNRAMAALRGHNQVSFCLYCYSSLDQV